MVIVVEIRYGEISLELRVPNCTREGLPERFRLEAGELRGAR